jgi:hypothetical protein
LIIFIIGKYYFHFWGIRPIISMTVSKKATTYLLEGGSGLINDLEGGR